MVFTGQDLTAQVWALAYLEFEDSWLCAKTYFDVIDKASPEQQYELFALALQTRGAVPTSAIRFGAFPMNDRQIASDYGQAVNEWCDEVLSRNLSLEEAAHILWGTLRRMSTYHIRIYVLHQVMKRLAPYARLDDSLLVSALDDTNRIEATEAAVPAVASLFQLTTRDNRQPAELAAILVNLLVTLGSNRAAQEVLLRDFLEH